MHRRFHRQSLLHLYLNSTFLGLLKNQRSGDNWEQIESSSQYSPHVLLQQSNQDLFQ